jgi:hypothetical protein
MGKYGTVYSDSSMETRWCDDYSGLLLRAYVSIMGRDKGFIKANHHILVLFIPNRYI